MTSTEYTEAMSDLMWQYYEDEWYEGIDEVYEEKINNLKKEYES